MTSILHVVHAKAVEGIGTVVDDLKALLEGSWLSLDITSTDQENLIAWRLDVSEVVLEGLLSVDRAAEDLLLGQVVLIDVFRVTLKHIN